MKPLNIAMKSTFHFAVNQNQYFQDKDKIRKKGAR